MHTHANRCTLLLVLTLTLVLSVLSCQEPARSPVLPLSTPAPAYVVTLPLVARNGGGPGGVTVYDCEGDVSTAAWLTERFGAVTWTVGESEPHLAALRACCGDCPAVHVVHVENEQGEPVPYALVVFSWPDAPVLPSELQHCGLTQGIYGPTNDRGDIGFGLGRGSYYFPPAGGPHTVWIGNAGDCLSGIGMLGGTNHESVSSDWLLTDPEQAQGAFVDWMFSPGAMVSLQTIQGRWLYVVGP